MASATFDDRDGWIWFDGQFVPWRDARVHVLTHGLHYASSVFEGERMYDGEIFKLTDHTKRLFRSAELLDMDMPFTVAEIDEACKETCRRNGLTDAYLRPIAWRGSETLGVASKGTKVHVAIACWSWPSYFDPEEKKRGIRITHAKWRRPDPATIPSEAKAAGLYMICTLSKDAAEREGYADALMLDYRGYVAEMTARLLPKRHHPALADRAGALARLRGGGAAYSARGDGGLYRVLHHRLGRRGDPGARDRRLLLHAGQYLAVVDGRLFEPGSA
jgi:branched-chain amino acid aminotransferase